MAKTDKSRGTLYIGVIVVASILSCSQFLDPNIRSIAFGGDIPRSRNDEYSYLPPNTVPWWIEDNQDTQLGVRHVKQPQPENIRVSNLPDVMRKETTTISADSTNPSQISNNNTNAAKDKQQEMSQDNPNDNNIHLIRRNQDQKLIVPATSTVKNDRVENQPSEIGARARENDNQTLSTEALTNNQIKQKPLNVLILYPDDWRYDSIGGVGPYVQTPFLNELARDGVHFTHNCVTTSICWISRASFLTGQYAARHKSLYTHHTYFYEDTFIQKRTAWPVVLQDAGYYTGHIGKWQFLDDKKLVRDTFFNWTSLHEGSHWYDVKNRTTNKKEKIHASDRARDDAIEFLKTRPKDVPFALTVAFYPPKAVGTSSTPGAQWSPKPETEHMFENDTIPMPPDTFASLPRPLWTENVGRKRYIQRFNHTEKYQVSIKRYFRMIYEVDQACKDIIEKLKQDGLYDDTLIIFTTDNGFFLGEHGMAGKWYPYEESIRVPLIVRDPRIPDHKRNRKDDSFTLNIDLAETILGAAGLESPSVMQGRDMADLYLRDAQDWRTEFYYEYPKWGLPTFPTVTALVRKDYKYMFWPQFRQASLYHMESDPHEMTDLSNQTEYQQILKEMTKRHNQLKRKAL